jgi:hypothetical protein
MVVELLSLLLLDLAEQTLLAELVELLLQVNQLKLQVHYI